MSTPASPASYVAVIRQWAEETTNRLTGADPADAADVMRRAVMGLGERLAWAEQGAQLPPGWRPRRAREGRDALEARLARLLGIWQAGRECPSFGDGALGAVHTEIDATTTAWLAAVREGMGTDEH